ncbi:hypothetical protein ACWD4X_32670, partial [Streptomyces termitum]
AVRPEGAVRGVRCVLSACRASRARREFPDTAQGLSGPFPAEPGAGRKNSSAARERPDLAASGAFDTSGRKDMTFCPRGTSGARRLIYC